METAYATRFDISIGTLPDCIFVFCMVFLINGLFSCNDAVFSVRQELN